jgi:hypothetical protein
MDHMQRNHNVPKEWWVKKVFRYVVTGLTIAYIVLGVLKAIGL